jgi:ribosome-binding factor A
VTVTGVDVTQDLRHAKVVVSVMGSDTEKAATFEGLASTASHLRSRVGRALRLRVAPEIHFREDESVARAARIESLLADIKSGSSASKGEDENT